MRTITTLAFILAAASAWPCSHTTSYVIESDSSLVKSADAIVLARVTSIEPGISHPLEQRRPAIIHLEVVETLKGAAGPQLSLSGNEVSGDAAANADFDAHRAAQFWAGMKSNSVSPGDCKDYGKFQLNEMYLIFVREDSHYHGFENIRSPDDLWLQVVRLWVKGSHL